jgi:alpha-glucoside transport system substrate-binding protein
VLPIACSLIAVACGDDDDGAADTAATQAPDDAGGTTAPGGGTTVPEAPGAGGEGEVTVYGVEDSEVEAGSMQAALAAFSEEFGIAVTYVGSREFEQSINSQVLGGNPPDIAVFAQPGKIAQFAEDGAVLPVPDDVVAAVAENWDQSWLDFTNVDGVQYGIPNKSDAKSLVWYIPSVWEDKGYEVPTTLTDFFALTEEMIANGDTPLCVGIESGPATGWPFTDWVEEIVLRDQGIDYYNQWVAHEVPFNDPPVVEAMERIGDLWNTEGAVFATGGSIAATAFGDNSEPLLNGDCMMHRQAGFFAAFFPTGTAFGDGDGEVDTFYFPSDEGTPVLVSGSSVAAFRDAPEVWQVMEYFGSPEYADTRQAAQTELAGGILSGFLTANTATDRSLYTDLEQSFLDVLNNADPAAFDGSDDMPAAVGSGSFWTEGTAFVNGDQDAQTTADNIEASWQD